MYWLCTEWKTDKSEFNYRRRRLLSHHSIQTISGVQLAFYPVGIGRKSLYDLKCWRLRTRGAKTPFSPTFSRDGSQGQLNETMVQKWVNERALREYVELIEAEHVRLLMLHMTSHDLCACSKTPPSQVKNTAHTSKHGQQRIADLMRPTGTSDRTAAAH